MKRRTLAFVFFGTLTLAACATSKSWVATGGSRADATVRLAYTYGPMEAAQVDEAQAQTLAERRCAVWGYSGAEPFGGNTTTCSMPTGGLFGGGCAEFMVTREYQCTGTGTPGQSATIIITEQ